MTDRKASDIEVLSKKLDGVREAVMLIVSALSKKAARESGFVVNDERIFIPGYTPVYDVWLRFGNDGKRVRLGDWRAFVADSIVSISGIDFLPDAIAKDLYRQASEKLARGSVCDE